MEKINLEKLSSIELYGEGMEACKTKVSIEPSYHIWQKVSLRVALSPGYGQY